MTKQLRSGMMLSVALLAAQLGYAASQANSAAQNRIEREVRRELVTLPFYSLFDHFTFRVEGYTVTLMGKVSRPTLKSDAENVIKKIEGVEKVANQIEVLPLSPNDDRLRLALYRADLRPQRTSDPGDPRGSADSHHRRERKRDPGGPGGDSGGKNRCRRPGQRSVRSLLGHQQPPGGEPVVTDGLGGGSRVAVEPRAATFQLDASHELHERLLSSVAIAILAVCSCARAQDHPAERAVARAGSSYTPPTGKERRDLYVRRAFLSPGVLFRAAGPALGSHLKNRPPEWGQGMEGYGRRVANRFGRFALKETYEAAGAAALGHEVRYLRSTRSGFLPRAGQAMAATFITYDRNGRRTPHIARLGSAFAAEFTGNLWMPAGYRTGAEAVRGVGIELGMNSVFNLFREFSPELKRVLPWK